MHLVSVLIGLLALAIGVTVAHIARENLGQPGWRSYIMALVGLTAFAIAVIVIALGSFSWEYLLPFAYGSAVFIGLNIYEKYVRSH